MTEMVPLEGVEVRMATPVETVIENIQRNVKRNLREVHDLPEWRFNTPIALVAGGPSLGETYEELRKYRHVMACGSVHDFLSVRGICPSLTVIHDPDPVMALYLKHSMRPCKYLVTSYAHDDIFKALHDRDVALWHPSGG